MKIFARLFLLSAVMFTGFSISHADGVTDVRIEANEDFVSMFWDALPSDDFDNAEGYALQFSDRQTNVQINKAANLFFRPGETSVSLRRNSFTNNVYYYTRVYSYGIDDETNAKIKGNGSKLVKWKVDAFNRVEKTDTTVNDPVVVVNSSSSSSSSADKDALFDFGELRSTAFDTFLNLSWSKPVLMASSDFDGFLVKISTNSDLSDPILTQTYDRDEIRTRIKGLQPNTQYYVGAYFYEEKGGQDVTFGNKNIKAIKTIAAIPRDGSTRAARNIVKIEKGFYGKHVTVDGSSTASTSTATTTSTSTTTSTPKVVTSSTASINSASQSTVRARIAALKEQVRALQTELRRWEAKLDGNTSSSTTTSTRTTSRTSATASGNSRLSKLKALLEARRNNR